ncbi:hypothetical protein [Roseicyclus mahoneyensis]|uniref:Uncharacterized protein n=1 Tax=Roseicyclus mahoneyensis TaxID=164332 RepID=A0A316GYU7_9RHOB|nr:hypothetical protein [Roseicyclus mahoneyensis]PWK60295.1 hypothetical protein C7455_105280 [Roseicyclus mahoneyensis]
MFDRPTRFAPLALALIMIGCAAPDPLTDELPNMGDFRLGHNIVVADSMQQIPPSRDATSEEWVAILTSEIDRRFGAYEGDRLYHIGIAIDGYALAPPGVPLVLNPRSILVLSVNVWDDAAGVKLHDDPEQILVMEGASSETAVIGSGLARTREEQMQVLARNAARQVQRWMLDNPEWFSIDPDAAPFQAATIEPAVVAEVVESPTAGPVAEPVTAPAPLLPSIP